MAGCLAALALAGVAGAHHSTAEFDYRKTELLEGTVKEVQWKNPHSFIILLVPGNDGSETQWAVETGTPNINIRAGWTKDSVKAGDRVKMNIAPTRDGKPRGTLRVLTFPDGHQLRGVAALITPDKDGLATFGPPAAPSGAPPGGRPAAEQEGK